MTIQDDLFDQGCREILGLHAFFESWMKGTWPGADYARLESALGPDFEMITPDGVHLSRRKVLESIAAARGSRADDSGFAIRIKRLRPRWIGTEAGVLMYEEWQESGAGSPGRGRISSALFAADPDAPEGVIWIHLQETWLPAT